MSGGLKAGLVLSESERAQLERVPTCWLRSSTRALSSASLFSTR